MARPLRIEFPGAVYHITARGNGRESTFLSDDDRILFYEVLTQVVERFGWLCHAWCLMTNHYHLMIETPNGNLSRGMRHLNGVYTQRFNRAHDRVGHVFQGRYKAILVEKDSHLLALCRYIVRNPVAAGMVSDTASWLWSSYRATAGLVQAPPFACLAWVLEQFGGDRTRYQEFVAQAPVTDAPLAQATGTGILGGRKFRDDVQSKVAPVSEVPRAQQHFSRPKLGELESGSGDRGEWMSAAYREHGFTMREIAGYAGVHYSLVSKIIKAWEGK